MKLLNLTQVILLNLGVLILLAGILTGAHILPSGVFLLTPGGLQRMANTLILLSIALGVLIVVRRK